jgi:hypothetical protein
MNTSLRTVALFSLLALIATTAAAKSGWTESGYLDEIEATGLGKFIVRGTLADNPSGCRNETGYYLDYSTNGAEQIYSLLLQSIATGNRVKLHVTGSCELNGLSEINSASIYAK